MAARRMNEPNEPKRRRPPATTPMARERQLIAHAVDLAEKQLLDGTASAQVVSHYLKLGSSREMLEQERLAHEVELLKIKAEALASQKRVEELYSQAMDAFRSYQGGEPLAVEDPDD